jgi:hypothetical protein
MSDFLNDIIDDERVNLHIEQGSEEWEQIRLGRFTSSEFYKLMSFGKRLMTTEELKLRPKSGKGSKTTTVTDYSKFSETGMTYIKMKVAETLTGIHQEQAYAYPLVYGKMQEPEAVAYFEKITGLETEVIGFQPFGSHAGGSADRVIKGAKIGLEVKCPQTIDKQIDYLYLNDAQDLKDLYPDYYWQCVTNMFWMDFEQWWIRFYDDRYILPKHKMTGVDLFAKDVQDDYDMIAKVLERAVQEKLLMLKTLNA